MLEISLGSGIAIGTVSISAATIIISVIKNKSSNGNGNGAYFPKLCDEKHKNVDKRFDGQEAWMREIRDDVKELRSDVKELIARDIKED